MVRLFPCPEGLFSHRMKPMILKRVADYKFKLADEDKSGEVDFREFLGIYADILKERKAEEAQAAAAKEEKEKKKAAAARGMASPSRAAAMSTEEKEKLQSESMRLIQKLDSKESVQVCMKKFFLLFLLFLFFYFL